VRGIRGSGSNSHTHGKKKNTKKDEKTEKRSAQDAG